MQTFIISLFKFTAIQLAGIFGIFFIFGFILSKLQEWTQKKYYRTIGWRGILWTAWIGTPFHEFGHYFFAKLFRHKVHAFRIFEPNQATGELGYVDHSFNRFSLYQKVGNFFIGAAPMIFGSLILTVLVYFFLPNGKEIFLPIFQAKNMTEAISTIVQKSFVDLFNAQNIHAWNFWLFMYLSFCIASHLAPSQADRKGMWSGFIYIFIIMILINIFGLLFQLNITDYILKMSQYFWIFAAIFLYATIISLTHFIFAHIILSILNYFHR